MEEQTTGDAKKLKRIKSTKRFHAFLAFLVFVGLVSVVSVLITTHRQQAKVQVAEVRITKSGFKPSTLVVQEGTKIIWTNSDNARHQVVANPYPSGDDLPGLRSEILNNTQTYTYLTDKAGSFGYHDQLKPTVNGTIVIQK